MSDPDEFAREVAKALVDQAIVGLWKFICSLGVLLFVLILAAGLSAFVKGLVH